MLAHTADAMTDSLESKIDQALAQAGKELLLLEQLDKALPAAMLSESAMVSVARHTGLACLSIGC
jgi:hypothetical protein